MNYKIINYGKQSIHGFRVLKEGATVVGDLMSYFGGRFDQHKDNIILLTLSDQVLHLGKSVPPEHRKAVLEKHPILPIMDKWSRFELNLPDGYDLQVKRGVAFVVTETFKEPPKPVVAKPEPKQELHNEVFKVAQSKEDFIAEEAKAAAIKTAKIPEEGVDLNLHIDKVEDIAKKAKEEAATREDTATEGGESTDVSTDMFDAILNSGKPSKKPVQEKKEAAPVVKKTPVVKKPEPIKKAEPIKKPVVKTPAKKSAPAKKSVPAKKSAPAKKRSSSKKSNSKKGKR